jgi:hypothetical protein
MNKEKLFGLKRKETIVELSDDVKVVVKELMAGEMAEYTASLYKFVNGKAVPQLKDQQAKLVALSCYEDNGEHMFSKTDTEMINTLPYSVIEKLYNAAEKLNEGSAKN